MIAMAPPRPSRPRPSPPSTALPPQPQIEPPVVPAQIVKRPAPAVGQARDTCVPLIPGPAAAALARAHLRAAISSWRLPVDVDVAVLLVSELVTNAVTHGDEGTGALAAVTMLIRCCGGELRVEVHDRSRDMPVPASPEVPDDSETGRGLMLVDALADAWGYYRTPGGKAVYFTLPLQDWPRASPNGVVQAG